MSIEIPAIPQGAAGNALVTHLNDRLRRISQNLGAGATGAAGSPGTPGSSSPTGSSGPVTIAGTAVTVSTASQGY
jgi:hypothetical protein